jgi:tetratricopeptide (TPR) repeat protein
MLLNQTTTRRNQCHAMDQEERAKSYVAMARLYIACESRAEAQIAVKTSGLMVEGLPYDNEVLLQHLMLEAEYASSVENYESAILAWTKILDAQERVFGSMSEAAASAVFQVGYNLFMKGKFHESWHCFDVCLQIRNRILGPLHPVAALTCVWAARAEGAAGNTVESYENFNKALEKFDAATSPTSNMNVLPIAQSQALVDVAALLYRDVTESREGTAPFDVKRMMTLGKNYVIEVKQALSFLDKARALTMPLAQDPHHKSIAAIDELRDACEDLLAKVTQDIDEAVHSADRAKRVAEWSKTSEPPKQQKHPLWFRMSLKIHKLRD